MRLAVDAVTRFRAADGFSHSRALAFQITLAILPGIIAVVGLAATLDVDAFTAVVRDTIAQLAPGAVGDILTDALRQGTSAARADSGETALVGGALAAAIAGTTAMAQVERGANRIYGTERDRPFLRKYLNAALLAATAGTLAVASAALLVGGSAIRSALEWGDTFDAVWTIARWPVGAALTIASVALLFERAPRRRQPEASWLAVGAVIAAVLWLVFMAALTVYVDATRNFGATYGPIAGTIGLLLWAMLSAVALFGGLAVAAQLEAVRAGVPRRGSSATRTSSDAGQRWVSSSNGGPSGTGSEPATRSEIRAPSTRCAPPDPTSAGDGPGSSGSAWSPSVRSTRPSVVSSTSAMRSTRESPEGPEFSSVCVPCSSVPASARAMLSSTSRPLRSWAAEGSRSGDVMAASVNRDRCLVGALPGHPNVNAYADVPGATARCTRCSPSFPRATRRYSRWVVTAMRRGRPSSRVTVTAPAWPRGGERTR